MTLPDNHYYILYCMQKLRVNFQYPFLLSRTCVPFQNFDYWLGVRLPWLLQCSQDTNVLVTHKFILLWVVCVFVWLQAIAKPIECQFVCQIYTSSNVLFYIHLRVKNMTPQNDTQLLLKILRTYLVFHIN